MPIIVKPLDHQEGPLNPLNRPTDGYDPLVPYQMIPLGKTREMVVEMGDFKAELNLTIPDISSMSNFRILRQATPSLFPLPGPEVQVRRIVLPERSVVQFTLSGRAVGMTVLEGRDQPVGAPPLKPDFKLGVSVKDRLVRQFAVCYVFDRVHRDTGARQDIDGHLSRIHKVFHDQANISIVNADGPSAGTPSARTITLDGSMGKTFDREDDDLVDRVMDTFDAQFPGVSARMHGVVFQLPVPITRKSKPGVRLGGVNIRWRRRSGQLVNLLLIEPLDRSGPSKRKIGGPTHTPVQIMRHIMAHEIGHSLGLRHEPNKAPPETVGRKIKEINPIFFTTPQLFNLMFPSTFLISNRITGAQVEIMHLLGPQLIPDVP